MGCDAGIRAGRSGGRGLGGGCGFGGRLGDEGAAGRAFVAGFVGAKVEKTFLAESMLYCMPLHAPALPLDQRCPRTEEENRPERGVNGIGRDNSWAKSARRSRRPDDLKSQGLVNKWPVPGQAFAWRRPKRIFTAIWNCAEEKYGLYLGSGDNRLRQGNVANCNKIDEPPTNIDGHISHVHISIRFRARQRKCHESSRVPCSQPEDYGNQCCQPGRRRKKAAPPRPHLHQAESDERSPDGSRNQLPGMQDKCEHDGIV